MDDFRRVYYDLWQDTPVAAKVMSWWDYVYQITGKESKKGIGNTPFDKSELNMILKFIAEDLFKENVSEEPKQEVLPGRYEDPSASGIIRRKVVTFLNQNDEESEDIIEVDDTHETLPLIQVHPPPLATSAPKPSQTTPRPANTTSDRPYIQMRPKLPPKKGSTKTEKMPPAPPPRIPTPK